MTQREKNQVAFHDYCESKANIHDNGNAWWFDANVRYTNHTTGNIYNADNTKVHAGVDHGYGDIKVHAVDIPDVDDVYVEWSTNFNKWTFSDGILTINGSGPKGNYTIIIA